MNRENRLVVNMAVSFAMLSVLISGAAGAHGKPRALPKAPRKPAIIAKGYLFSHTARPGQPIGFAMTISNSGPAASGQIWLEPANRLGFSITKLCVWKAAAFECPSNAPNPRGQSAHQVAPDVRSIPPLEPGQSIAISGILTVDEPALSQTVAMVVGWTSANGAPPETKTVSIGDINPPAPKTLVSSTWYTVIKDLLLPVALLLLPFLFKIGARRRAQIDQTWNLMLPESYKLMTRHYMPLDGSLKRITAKLKDHLDKTAWKDDEIAKFLFEMALFGKRIRRMGKAVGGFYFKNRMGEVLASGCHNAYFSAAWKNPENTDVEKNYSQLLNHVQPFESLDSFLKKLGPTAGSPPAPAAVADTSHPASGNPPAQPAEEAVPVTPLPIFRKNFDTLKEWLKGDEVQEAYHYLCGLHAVLRFEMNRPFEYWYDSEEPFEIEDDTRKFLRDHADKIGEGYEIENFKEQLERYLTLSSERKLLMKPKRWVRFRLWLGC
jgi:hypothetical protein